MKNLRKTLMAGAGAVALLVAPALAGPAFAQANVDTMTGTSAAAGSTSQAGTGNMGATAGGRMDAAGGQDAGAISADVSRDASPQDDLDTRGYTGLALAENAITPHDQVALNAVDPRGNPVRLVVDRESGIVIRETEMRTLPTPSKNQ